MLWLFSPPCTVHAAAAVAMAVNGPLPHTQRKNVILLHLMQSYSSDQVTAESQLSKCSLVWSIEQLLYLLATRPARVHSNIYNWSCRFARDSLAGYIACACKMEVVAVQERTMDGAGADVSPGPPEASETRPESRHKEVVQLKVELLGGQELSLEEQVRLGQDNKSITVMQLKGPYYY